MNNLDEKRVWIVTITDEAFLDYGSEYNLARLRDYCREHKGKKMRLTPIQNHRTLTQNRFYWAYLAIISQETGNDIHDLHEYFKRSCLPPKFIKVMGKEIKIPQSTTDLNKLEFTEFIDRISMECGVPVPDPRLLADYVPH